MHLNTEGRLGVAILSSYAAGFVGSRFFSADWELWYSQLIKPAYTPPTSVFFPVWMILYALMGIALGVIWAKAPMWHSWVGLFYVSLAFNAAWVMFFFGYHAIFIALAAICCLLVLLAILTISAAQIDRRAFLLMIPYLSWVAFASYLNAGIWLLN